MRAGIEGCGVFLLFLSSGCLARPYVCFELETALELEKKIVLCHEIDKPDQKFDFAADRKLCPEHLTSVLDSCESIPFRRRGYEVSE